MGRQASVRNHVRADHLIRAARIHHEEVVGFAVAGLAMRGVNHAAHLFQPTGGPEVVGGAVPVTADHPAAREAGQGEGNGVKQIHVALRLDANVVAAVDASAVHPALAHRRHPSQHETAGGVQVLRGRGGLGSRHADEGAGSHRRACGFTSGGGDQAGFD